MPHKKIPPISGAGSVARLAAFTRAESERVIDLMMGFAHSAQCAGPMQQAMFEIVGDAGCPTEDVRIVTASEEFESVFHTWFMFDRPITEDGHTLVDVFLEGDSFGLSRGERRFLERMRESHLRPYEVREVRGDSGLLLWDLWRDESVEVNDRVASYYAHAGGTICARVVHGPQGEREMHGLVSFPRAEMEALLSRLRLMHGALSEKRHGLSDREFFKAMAPLIQRSWLESFRSPSRNRGSDARGARTRAGDRILQVKVALQKVRPQVWRRLLVPERMTLGTLSKTILKAMGWEDYHLHDFEIDGISYGVPDPEYPDDTRNERGRKLSDFDFAEGASFKYRYDFGDNWCHRVLVEKVLDPQPGAQYPICVAGARACPPEDVGGAGGYAEFRRVLRNPKHRDHAHFREWSRRDRRDFDPEAFDVEEVNARLRPRVWSRKGSSYRRRPPATQRFRIPVPTGGTLRRSCHILLNPLD